MPEPGRKCGAKNRQGGTCGNWALKGKTRCKFHGGKSTGPKTPEGLAHVATLSLDHGAYSKREAYARILGIQDPETFRGIPTELVLREEIQFARYKLARTEHAAGGGDGGLVMLAPQLVLLQQIRKLVATEKLLNPGGDATGAFTVAVTVQGGAPPALPVLPAAAVKPPEDA